MASDGLYSKPPTDAELHRWQEMADAGFQAFSASTILRLVAEVRRLREESEKAYHLLGALVNALDKLASRTPPERLGRHGPRISNILRDAERWRSDNEWIER